MILHQLASTTAISMISYLHMSLSCVKRNGNREAAQEQPAGPQDAAPDEEKEEDLAEDDG
jgi:hypothetical protein